MVEYPSSIYDTHRYVHGKITIFHGKIHYFNGDLRSYG